MIWDSKRNKFKSQREPPFKNCWQEIGIIYTGILMRKFDSSSELFSFMSGTSEKKIRKSKYNFQSVENLIFFVCTDEKKGI